MINGIKESFEYQNLSTSAKQDVFNVFKAAYEKATGSAWDFNKFNSRAYGWQFFGEEDGYVTLRPQNSGYYKLTGVAGNPRSILRGLGEIMGKNIPVWGMVSQDISNILTRKFEFRKPNKIETIAIFKMISSNVFGDVKYTVNKDGGVTFDYADVGSTTKYFVGNKPYFSKVRQELFKTVKNKLGLSKYLNEGEELDEKRAVDDYTVNSYDEIMKVINTIGYKKLYISFRETVNVSTINTNNKYNTPTGLYCYPLISYKSKIENADNIKDFTNCFPYMSSSKYIHMFSLESDENVLFSSAFSKSQINGYVEKIRDYYPTNDNIQEYCLQWFNGTFKGYGSYTAVQGNLVSGIWLFLYAIADQIKRGSVAHSVTILAAWLGIDGFVDDGCLGYIHEAEKCQAVFFNNNFRKIIGNYQILSAHDDRGDVPLKFDAPKDVQNGDGSEQFDAYRKQIEKKFNTIDISFEDSYKKIKSNIKAEIPNVISVNGIWNYYDRMCKKSLKNINYSEIYDNDDKAKAYYNTLINNKFNIIYIVHNSSTFAIARSDAGDLFAASSNMVEPLAAYKLDKSRLQDYSSTFLDYYINAVHKHAYSLDSVERFDNNGQAFATNFNGDLLTFDANGNEIPKENVIINFDNNINLAKKMNYLLGEHRFARIDGFNIANNTLAVAYSANSSDKYFINKKGEKDLVILSRYDLNMMSVDVRAIYINQLIDENKYYEVNSFDEGNEHLARATTFDGDTNFINMDGHPSVSGLSEDDVNGFSARTLAAYMNTIIGKSLYKYARKVNSYLDFNADALFGDAEVYKCEIENDVAIYSTLSGGIPDIDLTKATNWNSTDENAIMLNTKFKSLRFNYAYKYADDVYQAKMPDKGYVFYNGEGKPTLEGIDINSYDLGNGERAAYFNTKLNTDVFHSVYGFNVNDMAEFSSLNKYGYINKNGETFDDEKGNFKITIADIENA